DAVSNAQVLRGLPTVAYIPREPGIELSTGREAKLRYLGEEALAISHKDVLHRIIKRASRTRLPAGAHKRLRCSELLGTAGYSAKNGAEYGLDAIELDEATTADTCYNNHL